MGATLVFVHLGPTLPKHLLHNLHGMYEMRPNQEIVLIHDNELSTGQKRKIPHGVRTFLYKREDDVVRALADHAYNRNFRNGFWQISLIRIFALLQFQLLTGTKGVIHIESDVVLFKNFPWEKFENLQDLAWLQFNENRDVAAILFCPNLSSATWLREKILGAILKNNELTDMKVLSKISNAYPDKVTLLPIAPTPNSDLFIADISDQSRLRNSLQTDYFGGIFDSAPLGMWTLGQDPRNHNGVIRKGISLLDSYVQPEKLTIDSSFGDQLMTESGIPIFNLHIHCKELKYFKSTNFSLAIADACKATKGELESHFSSRALLENGLDFIKRNGARAPIVLIKKLLS